MKALRGYLERRRRRRPPPTEGLPREVLAWCLLAAFASLLPLGLQLKGELMLLLVALGAAGAGAGLRGYRVPAWLRLLLTMLAAGLALYAYGFKVGRDTGAALLAAMLALKLLETRSVRDARSLLSFGLFAVMASFLMDQGPLTLALALLAGLASLAALARVHEHAEGETRPPAPRLRLAGTGRLLLLSLPLALVGFLLFPRLPQPLWGLPENATEARTGLSDRMAPGDIVNLLIDDSPVLRAEFQGRLPETRELYWRGPVLTLFDGRAWSALPMVTPPSPEIVEVLDEPLRYDLVQEPTDRRWIVALDLPLAVPEGSGEEVRLNPDHTLVSRRPFSSVSRHQLTSATAYRFEPVLDRGLRMWALQLPSGFNPRTRELVRGWQAEGLRDHALVVHALELFNREFSYSLAPPPLGRDSVDDFLFNTREGFCEHYASAFTVMMRMAGLPARVVTGYHGGFHNRLGNYIIVRNSDAHAWSEVWIEGDGWLRVDPTGAVAPERVLSGNESASPRRHGYYAWAGPLLDFVDWLRHGWNTAVLGFNAARQLDLLAALGFDGRDWRQLGLALALGTGLALALTLLLVLRPARGSARDPLVQAYARFCRRLARRGLPRAPHEPPLLFAERAAAAFPADAQELLRLSRDYADQRYAPDADAEARHSLVRALHGFRPSRRQDRPDASLATHATPDSTR